MSARRSSLKRSQRGFSLITLAVILAIVGVLLAGFLRLYSIWVQKQNFELTRARLKDVRTALTDYMITHGHLPCPAAPVPENNAGFDCTTADKPPEGVIAYSAGDAHADDPATQVWIGPLPASELRLDATAARDAWGNDFTYAVSRALTLPNTLSKIPLAPGILSITDAEGNNLAVEPGKGRYAVISHGPTALGAWAPQGGRRPCQEETLDGKNCDGKDTFIVAPWTTAPGAGFYDDLVVHDGPKSDANPQDQVALCGSELGYFRPDDALADKDGCKIEPQWEGACLQTVALDMNGKEVESLPALVARGPATGHGTGCGCAEGYAPQVINGWDGGPLSPWTVTAFRGVNKGGLIETPNYRGPANAYNGIFAADAALFDWYGNAVKFTQVGFIEINKRIIGYHVLTPQPNETFRSYLYTCVRIAKP